MTREKLRRYKDVLIEIRQLEDDLLHWRSWAEKCTHTIGTMGLAVSHQDRMAFAMAKLEEIEEATLNKMVELAMEKIDIECALEKLSGLERVILKKHYIEGKTWSDVADELGYTWRWIARLHERALIKLCA